MGVGITMLLASACGGSVSVEPPGSLEEVSEEFGSGFCEYLARCGMVVGSTDWQDPDHPAYTTTVVPIDYDECMKEETPRGGGVYFATLPLCAAATEAELEQLHACTVAQREVPCATQEQLEALNNGQTSGMPQLFEGCVALILDFEARCDQAVGCKEVREQSVDGCAVRWECRTGGHSAECTLNPESGEYLCSCNATDRTFASPTCPDKAAYVDGCGSEIP